MLNKVEIHTCKTSIENGKEYVYIYYVTETLKDIMVENLEVSLTNYGIGIIREEVKNGVVVETFEERVDSVSPVRSKVMDMLNWLVKYEVSPIHLLEVISEDIDNCINDYEIEAISRLNVSAIAL